MELTRTASVAIHLMTYTTIRYAIVDDINIDVDDLMYFIRAFEEANEEEKIEAYNTIFTEMNEPTAFEIKSIDDLNDHLSLLSLTYSSTNIDKSLFYKTYKEAGYSILNTIE